MRRPATALLSTSLLVLGSVSSAPAQTLPERVSRLERELAALKAAVAAKAAGAPGRRGGAGPKGDRGATGPQGPKGDRGEPGSAKQPEFPLFLRSPEGKDLILLTRTKSGSATLNLANSRGMRTLSLNGGDPLYPALDGGYASFFDGKGRKRAYLGTTQVGEVQLSLYNSIEKEMVTIAALEPGGGQILLNGKQVKDYAEVLEVASREGVKPGSVMSVAGDAGRIGLSTIPYDRRVVGVISGAGGLQPGTVIGSREDGSNDLPLAVSGQVYVRVSLEGGAIEAGDLLVASSLPGVSMRAADPNRMQGAVIGKAMEAFGPAHESEGLVRMMVMLR